MLASSLAAISIGTPLRSTRAWIKAPWMADTQRPAPFGATSREPIGHQLIGQDGQ